MNFLSPGQIHSQGVHQPLGGFWLSSRTGILLHRLIARAPRVSLRGQDLPLNGCRAGASEEITKCFHHARKRHSADSSAQRIPLPGSWPA
jgi:hypothetical protein